MLKLESEFGIWVLKDGFKKLSTKDGKINSVKVKLVSVIVCLFLVTYLLSSFWHGFYLNYYFGFFYFYMVTEVQKVLYKKKLIDGVSPFGIKDEFTNKIIDLAHK